MSAAEETRLKRTGLPIATGVINNAESKELFFAVVGHIGSGISQVANDLKSELEENGYEVETIKASSAIKDWSTLNSHIVPEGNDRAVIEDTLAYQDLGDLMRESEDYAAVAQGMLKTVRNARAENTGVEMKDGQPVDPDDKKRAYIFDSIRHPAEVYLLRSVYHKSFILIGIVCQEEVRKDRLLDKFYQHKDKSKLESINKVLDLMNRDSDDKSKDHGQHVADAFFESDYFVDNTVDSNKDKQHWQIHEMLGRLIKIVTHSKVVRPTISETSMHHAFSAQIRSACLSRQVGAAIVDENGDIISTGSNEVPKAGGGVYGKMFSILEEENKDSRCVYEAEKYCRSTVEQNTLAVKISGLGKIKEGSSSSDDVITVLRKAGLKDLLEFSRAVHAEMDAITTAARTGKSLLKSKMFVTTFPCHYCARHIVASGVHEVQYIEPYPKSKAMSLHDDAITSDEIDWVPPGTTDDHKKNNKNYQKVLFKPFVGVTPRLYSKAFKKDRSLKNSNTGDFKIGAPEWGSKWHVKRMSYTQLEADLTIEQENEK